MNKNIIILSMFLFGYHNISEAELLTLDISKESSSIQVNKNLNIKKLIQIKNEIMPDKNKVWLTFDACGGKFDWETAQFLVDNNLKSSIFVTSIWIKNNYEAVAFIIKNKDIFTVENHGNSHKGAFISREKVFGVPGVTKDELLSEFQLAQDLIEKTFKQTPVWYRGATALYDKESLDILRSKEILIAGYTIAGDMGGKATSNQIHSAISKARAGDIILMHINKPKSNVSKGLKKSLEYLKKLN